jgi:hypothetical protein
MKKRVYAGAIILGLGTVTFALAQRGAGPATPPSAPADSPAPRSPDKPRSDRAELHVKVARLRAEVEFLQLEHDRIRDCVSAGLRERVEGLDGDTSRQVARDYMRIGAELVGKGPEFEAAMQDKGEDLWQVVNKAVAASAPAELDRWKQEFLRVATDLNRKKIDLVELEIRLDESM